MTKVARHSCTSSHRHGSVLSSSKIARLLLITLLFGCNNTINSVSGKHSLLQNIRKMYPDFVPNTVIDVGANQGKYAEYIRQTFPTATIIMFEGSDSHYEVLQKFIENDYPAKSEYHLGILSSKDGDIVEYYDSAGSTGNSLFRENTEHFIDVKPIQKVTKTLDTVIAESKLLKSLRIEYEEQQLNRTTSSSTDNGDGNTGIVEPVSIDIIKTDVQGSELIVLQGARNSLAQATFVQLEGSIVEYNIGGACFYQIDSLLRSYGYYLYDMGDFAYNGRLFKTKGLGQFDVLYVRPSSPKLPQFLKENNATFCGDGRHPLDLPGVYDIATSRVLIQQQSQSQSRTSTLVSGSTYCNTAGINDGSDFYKGFVSGLFVMMIVMYGSSRLPTNYKIINVCKFSKSKQ